MNSSQNFNTQSQSITESLLYIFIGIIIINIFNCYFDYFFDKNSTKYKNFINIIFLIILICLIIYKKIDAIDITDIPVFLFIMPMISTTIKSIFSYDLCSYYMNQIRILAVQNNVNQDYNFELTCMILSLNQEHNTKVAEYKKYIDDNSKNLKIFEDRILSSFYIYRIPFLIINKIKDKFFRFIALGVFCFICIFLTFHFMNVGMWFIVVYLFTGSVFMIFDELGDDFNSYDDFFKCFYIYSCSISCGDLYKCFTGLYTNYQSIRNIN